ncbi:hypothetical protein A3J44_00970 [candidate division WOR-1 bacterium RIFCSPHIGHO2_02_FULL_45_12]|nr:MAG: hypothetical protein A3J44_00970 [candidate division WOR-1 bacterium RIFCSPHIGHO2_02_FULL_45_12]
MGKMNLQQSLNGDIKKFLEVYRFLSAEGKGQFEAQMAGSIKNHDEKTKKLYQSLLQSAKDGKSISEAIEAMGKAEPPAQP